MLRRICFSLGFLLVPLFAGCSEYADDFQYAPRPAVSEIPATQPQQPPAVSAFATVVGIKLDDPQEHLPTSVQIRLRLDNNGPGVVGFDPRTLDLSSGDLMRFLPPQLGSPQPVTVGPAQSAFVDVYFPFPQDRSYDNTDLQSLQLRWLITIDGHPVRQTVDFRRVSTVYYDPNPYWDYPYSPYGYYGGVVVVHGRWR